MKHLAAFAALFAVLSLTNAAYAFCGFYVAGGDAKLFNEATQVVLMRHDDQTVLSMQNNYEGPPNDFAMVIPVPQVLQKENVKTLEKGIFDKIDQLSAPRLVEYWEKDPCWVEPPHRKLRTKSSAMAFESAPAGAVKVEAQFKVAEYDIVVLSSTESTALDRWLKQENYNIPAGAEPYFKPYIESGMFFFVAKVDSKKVKYENGRAVLSPLRFNYTSKEFQLPIRLGMINSKGKQDLLVYILAQGKRYEVANYANAFIPTNIEVRNEVRNSFGEFYRALFDRTVEETNGAVVTEYSWDASTCDPCPGPTLDAADYTTLGADALNQANAWGWVLTRLHARYDRDGIGEDLVFREAPTAGGGREWRGDDGALEQGVKIGDGSNMFQGRYIIRHEWTGGVNCDNPVHGRWGGPEGSKKASATANPSANTTGAAPVTRKPAIALDKLVKQAIPEIRLTPKDAAAAEPPTDPAKTADQPAQDPAPTAPPVESAPNPKGGCTAAPGARPDTLLLLVAAVGFWRRRRSPKGRP